MDWEKFSVITAVIGILIAFLSFIRDLYGYELSWNSSKGRMSKFVTNKQVQIVLSITCLLGSSLILYVYNQQLQSIIVEQNTEISTAHSKITAQATEIASIRSTSTALLEERERLKSMMTLWLSNRSFNYQVQIQDAKNEKPIASATVILMLSDGFAPVDEFTDAHGLARLRIDETLSGKPGRLRVEAVGYELYEVNIDISQGSLPNVIKVLPIVSLTSLPIVTNEHLFTQEGFSKISFRWHAQPRTENEMHGYVHLNICFTAPYVWLRTTEVTSSNSILYDKQGIEARSKNEPCQPDLVPVRDLAPNTIIHIVLAATQEKEPAVATGYIYQIRVNDNLSDVEIDQLETVELQKGTASN